MINNFICCGWVANEPVVTEKDGKAIARFSLGINRIKEGVDYANFVAFGKTAETVEKYLKKGTKICAEGSFHSGSYEKNGVKIYTSDFWLNNFEFMSSNKAEKNDEAPAQPKEHEQFGFVSDEGLPFA